jgi:hypothetical protein
VKSNALSPGLSRADVLVALLVVVVAAGLVLAAASRVREAAGATSCQNDLKQLGLAAANYISVHGLLPPLVDQGDGAPTGRGLPSVFTNLLPFIEATPLVFRPERPPDYYLAHSTVVFTYPHKGETYRQVGGMANQVMEVFLDPADGTAGRLRDVPLALPDGTAGYYATASYAANGLAPWRVRAVPRAFPGGTANTILFGERPQVCRTAAGEEVYNLWGLGVYAPHMPAFAALTPAEPPGLWDTGQAAPAESLPDGSAADRDARVRVRVGREDAEPAPPDFATPVQVVRGGCPCDPRLPATPHRRGTQALMADGSLRVLGPDTSPWVLWAACLPARPLTDP